jgi:Ca2+/Na+ antiporter
MKVKKTLLKKLKTMALCAISLLFTVLAILIAEKISWFPGIFFGICSAVFIYMLFDSQKENTYYDEMFLSSDDSENMEYYDWGFYHHDHKFDFYWDKIHLITAFKRDLITYDDICLGIEHEFDFLTISESFPGWDKFKAEIENRFNLIESNWFEEMTNHAFGNNDIILYKKQMAK